MPRVSDYDAGDAAGYHVPGVWSGVLAAERTRRASVHRYLDDPREMLTLDADEYEQLQARVETDAHEWFQTATAAGKPVTVSRAVVRGVAPKEFLQQERDTKSFTVYPDDTIVVL